jgi:chromate transport protein ChrA
MEFFAAISLSIFLGFKIDKWLNAGFPLSVWLLPVLIIIGIIIKVFKDTSRKK